MKSTKTYLQKNKVFCVTESSHMDPEFAFVLCLAPRLSLVFTLVGMSSAAVLFSWYMFKGPTQALHASNCQAVSSPLTAVEIGEPQVAKRVEIQLRNPSFLVASRFLLTCPTCNYLLLTFLDVVPETRPIELVKVIG